MKELMYQSKEKGAVLKYLAKFKGHKRTIPLVSLIPMDILIALIIT
ncbi:MULTISPECIES: hypothetical protein [Dehalobacter]|nr:MULTISPECIES: hypothetical protein [unclassified Dehalobacter]EQB22404.1 hypothetical protein UNSWDHB_256 [Dehalobacter sp. UNSWDHB]MDJ0304665.1 hypothetical protein [Dehalobacter sp.]